MQTAEDEKKWSGVCQWGRIEVLAKWSLDENGEVEMKPTLSGFVSRIIFLIGTNVFQ